MNYVNRFQRDIDYGGGGFDDIEIVPYVDVNKVRNDKINILLDLTDKEDEKPSGVLEKVKDFFKW